MAVWLCRALQNYAGRYATKLVMIWPKDFRKGEKMKLEVTNPETGETRLEVAPDLPEEFLTELTTQTLLKKELLSRLDSLALSADAKALLCKMAGTAMKVGTTVVKIGHKILEVVLGIVSRFPNASFGLVFGAIAGALIGGIPLIGFVLGPVVTPLLAAFGLLMGVKADFADAALEGRIMEAVAAFDPLKGEAVD